MRSYAPYSESSLRRLCFICICTLILSNFMGRGEGEGVQTNLTDFPHNFRYNYLKVDTEACEQIFSWSSKYSRITRHMSREHFLFYILYLCDPHNWKR